MRIPRLIAVPFLLLFISACNFTLAADITPPPDYRSIEVAETQPALAGPLYPLIPPNPADGEALFAENCAPCHGETGMGDGQLADQLPFPAPSIGSAELARQATPAEWYRMVSLGKMERRMPAFTSLSERQRWDVVAYTFSLSASEQSIAMGAELFQANCASCHGEQGKGDGPQAANLSTSIKNLTSQEWMANQSAEDLFQAITSGKAPDMPAFEAQLSETERWAITDYVRWLTFGGLRLASAAQATPNTGEAPKTENTPAALETPLSEATATGGATPAPEAGPILGSISGSVTNSSSGEIPADLAITLHGFDDMQNVITDTTKVEPDGRFTFESVPMPVGRVFLATVEYSGATYGSDIAIAQNENPDLELPPINIYDTTTDASGLVVDRLHLFFEFTDANTLRVIELYIISNQGEKTLVASEEGQPTLTFTLPQGAENLEFQDGELGGRYVKTQDGFGDTVAIRPGSGSHQVLYAFDMPYNRKLDLVQPMTLATNAVVILVPEGTIKVKGDGLQDEGVRPAEEVNYQMYSRAGLSAGDELSLTITGSPTASGSLLSVGSRESLLVGVGVFGLVLVVTGIWLFRRNQLRVDEEDELEEMEPLVAPGSENAETVMDAILALDDLYKAGELPEEAYRQRRAELKARLKELMD